MPESHTARGALLLTLIFLVLTLLAYQGAPELSLTHSGVEMLQLIELRSAYLGGWYTQAMFGLGVLATLFGIYGGRHLIPTPPGWGRPAPTTAQIRLAERTAGGPTPTELGDV